MNNKKIKVWLPILFALTMVIGMYMGFKMRDNMPGKGFFSIETRRPIQEIIDLIQNKYVDEVKLKEITDTAIQALLSKLDPHSVFIPAQELQQANEDIAGQFFGIGVEFNILEDTLHVINVMKDGPSFKAGLLTGDKFIKVDGKLIAGKKIDSDAFRKMLRGNRGTKVDISLLRNHSVKQISISRDAIPLTSIDASYMMTDDIGFIRLNKFSTQTYREFMQSLEALNKKGMKKLILDLRGNGGGILDEAVEIADEFLEGDKLITYTEGTHVAKKEFRCRRVGQFEKGELIILADESSASASEVLIGALQDWDRAIVVGRRTFGKGLVQEQFELSDKSAIRLTVARYYTPIGRSIQRPYNNGDKAYYAEIGERFTNSNLANSDSTKKHTGKTFKTKAGKAVYEHGGISPDYFMPIDSAKYNQRTREIFEKGLIGIYAYKFYLGNKVDLNNYGSVDNFIKSFSLGEMAWQEFVNEAAKDSVSVSNLTEKQKLAIIILIKASIARHVWHNEGYFEVMNTKDESIELTLKLLSKNK